MKNTKGITLKAIVMACFLGIIVYGVALASSSANLKGYQVDFLGVTKNGENSTWTYAVTANGDEAYALSHWTLCIDCSCGYSIVSPAEGTYTTLSSYTPTGGSDVCAGTYNCQEAHYSVTYGYDPTTDLSGIKFENGVQALSRDNQVTHIFQIELHKSGDTNIGDTGVGVKAGTGHENGSITGPVCPPNAIQLASFSASANNFTQTPAFGIVLAFSGVLAMVGIGKYFRRS